MESKKKDSEPGFFIAEDSAFFYHCGQDNGFKLAMRNMIDFVMALSCAGESTMEFDGVKIDIGHLNEFQKPRDRQRATAEFLEHMFLNVMKRYTDDRAADERLAELRRIYHWTEADFMGGQFGI